jgi:hypothetical protein
MHGVVSLRLVPWLALLGAFAAGCATVPVIQTDYDAPPGSLRMATVSAVASRSEVLTTTDPYVELLASAGIPEGDIRDGSLVKIAIHCCNGPVLLTYGVAFAPAGIELHEGDVVEVRIARDPQAPGLDRLNVVTRIRQAHDDPHSRCAWLPEHEGLWLRAIYCDWMPGEGWKGIKNMYGQTTVWVKTPD